MVKSFVLVETDTWAVHIMMNGGLMNEGHELPKNDKMTHDLNDECVCGPTAEPVEDEDGGIGWYYIHHALDGRPNDNDH